MSLNFYNPHVREELELYHHGVAGQKWGDRNGPPYPLSANAHSSSEVKAGWRKSIGGGRNEELHDRKAVKKQQKIEKKVAKVSRKYDKQLERSQKEDERILEARKRNREKFENENRFDDITKMVKQGQDKYNQIIRDYKDAKISSLRVPEYKKSSAYKNALRNYKKQARMDNASIVGSRAMTKLLYTNSISASTADRINELKKSGKSTSEIAKITGYSKDTINAVE